MENEKGLSRRGLISTTLGAIGSLFATKALAQAANCGVTPRQTEGPFYPQFDRPGVDEDTDLTQVRGSSSRALGQVVFVQGKILDSDCQPVGGALVEIWQACHSGKYNHPNDPNRAPLDPNFQYWGRAISNERGEYRFKTVVPGAYPATAGWTRPPHIHFRVARLGFHELITQMYFAGETLNDRDQILRSIPAHERGSVIVEFNSVTRDDVARDPRLELGSKTGTFNITLRRP